MVKTRLVRKKIVALLLTDILRVKGGGGETIRKRMCQESIRTRSGPNHRSGSKQRAMVKNKKR